MQNILIVGGSGMLSKVVSSLNNQGDRTTVIARNQTKLENIRSLCKFPEHYHPISLDYEDYESLKACIQNEQSLYGTFDVVIAWIQSNESKAFSIIINEIMGIDLIPIKAFHILGSRSDLLEIKMKLFISSKCDYHQVQLGFIVENSSSSRWLTNDEISNGILKAVLDDSQVSLVGTLEPWHMSPYINKT